MRLCRRPAAAEPDVVTSCEGGSRMICKTDTHVMRRGVAPVSTALNVETICDWSSTQSRQGYALPTHPQFGWRRSDKSSIIVRKCRLQQKILPST
jgi:hypothetical protein